MSLEELFYSGFLSPPQTKKEVEETGFEEDPVLDDEIKFLSMEDFCRTIRNIHTRTFRTSASPRG